MFTRGATFHRPSQSCTSPFKRLPTLTIVLWLGVSGWTTDGPRRSEPGNIREGRQTLTPTETWPLHDFTCTGFYRIDFMSVDVEGAELIVLSTIDFNEVAIHYIVVENNAPTQPWTDLLVSKGFEVMVPGSAPLQSANIYDTWFVNKLWGTDARDQ